MDVCDRVLSKQGPSNLVHSPSFFETTIPKVNHDINRPLSRARLIPTQLLALAYNILFDVKFIRASSSRCESLC